MIYGADLSLAKRHVSTFESAKKRKLEFDLSLADTAELMSQTRCAITGKLFTDKGGVTPTSLTFERIDPTQGYVGGNVTAVLGSVNAFKGSTLDLFLRDEKRVLTDEQKIKLLRKVLYRIEKRVKAKNKPPRYAGASEITLTSTAAQKFYERFNKK